MTLDVEKVMRFVENELCSPQSILDLIEDIHDRAFEALKPLIERALDVAVKVCRQEIRKPKYRQIVMEALREIEEDTGELESVEEVGEFMDVIEDSLDDVIGKALDAFYEELGRLARILERLKQLKLTMWLPMQE